MENKNISKFDKMFQNLVKSIDENLHDFINDVETEKLINKVKNKSAKNLVKTYSFSKIDHPVSFILFKTKHFLFVIFYRKYLTFKLK